MTRARATIKKQVMQQTSLAQFKRDIQADNPDQPPKFTHMQLIHVQDNPTHKMLNLPPRKIMSTHAQSLTLAIPQKLSRSWLYYPVNPKNTVQYNPTPTKDNPKPQIILDGMTYLLS